MEIKEVTSEEAEDIQKGEPEKVLRKSDRILDNAKENLSPNEITKVNYISNLSYALKITKSQHFFGG